MFKPVLSTLSRSSAVMASMMLGVACTSLFMSGCEQKDKAPDVPALATASPQSQNQLELTLTPAQEKSLGLQTQTIEPIRFVTTVQSNGQIQAADYLQAHIFSTAQGKALNVPVTLGQTIHAGQTLVTLKSDQIDQLESDLLQNNLQNDSDIKQAEVQLRFSKVAYEREKYLYTKQVSAKADLETAQSQYEKDMANLQALKTKKQATINTAQNRLSIYGVGPNAAHEVITRRTMDPYISITSPRSGVLIARNLNNGEIVDPSKELFTVADLHTVWLVGNIYEKDVRDIRAGQPIDVTLDSFPGMTFRGHIHFMSNILDPTNRTLLVRGEITNPDNQLKPNMFARMTIQTGVRSAVAVPKGALQQLGDSSLVYVQLRPHVYVQRKVQTGQDNGQYVEILHGLNVGETIATQGTFGLKGIILKQTEGSD